MKQKAGGAVEHSHTLPSKAKTKREQAEPVELVLMLQHSVCRRV